MTADLEEKSGLAVDCNGKGTENENGDADSSYVLVNGVDEPIENGQPQCSEYNNKMASLNANAAAVSTAGENESDNGEEIDPNIANAASVSVEEYNNEEIDPYDGNAGGGSGGKQNEHVTGESQVNASPESDLDAVVNAAVEGSIDSTSQLEYQATNAYQDLDQGQSANADAVDEETKSDSIFHIRDDQDSDIVVINGVEIDVDLDQEEEEKREGKKEEQKEINDLHPKEDNLDTSASCSALLADVKIDENAVYDEKSVAETPFVEDLVDANGTTSQPSSSSEAFTSSDAETGINLSTPTDSDAKADPTNDITASSVQSEAEMEICDHYAQDNISESIVVNDFVQASQASLEQNCIVVASPLVCENFPVESNQSIPAYVITDMVTTETEVEKLDVNGSAIANTLPVDDTNVDKAENGLVVNDTTLEIKAENGPVVNDTTVEIEAENGLVVNDTNIEFEAENGPVVDNKEVKIEAENGPVVNDAEADDLKPEIHSDSISIVSKEEEDTLSNGNADIEFEVSKKVAECTGSNLVSADNPDAETCLLDSVEKEGSLPACPVDVEAESEVENASKAPSNDMHLKHDAISESEVLKGSVNTSEKALNFIQKDVHVDKEGDLCITANADEKTGQEVEVIDAVCGNGTSTSTPEGFSVDASDGQNNAAEAGKRPFYYMIRIPRYDDEKLKEEIKHAQSQVAEKTKIRDAIQAEIRMKKANCRENDSVFEAAVSEERVARDLLKAKRKEIDSVQSVISKVKNATDVEEIDSKIRNMEHMIQHETLLLKEEKQFIRDIKQLKQMRGQLSSNMGSQDEVQQAMDHKEQVEERLKTLRREADLLRDKVFKAEAATRNAKKKYNDESDKLHELQTQFRDANSVRQGEYAHLQSLRKQLYDKNKYFWKYKDDAKTATDLAFKGDKEELQQHCINQVERVMEVWNNNDEFRKEYMRCNMRSTLRRLRTLDGRSLGPEEEPPAIFNVREKMAKDNKASLASPLEVEKPRAHVEIEKIDDKPTAKVGDQKNQTAESKKPAKPAPPENGSSTVSGRNQIEEVRQEELKQSKKEEELARKAEELRKEEEAALLREQQRLEEKAKAKEAMERKKRNADKAQARAVLRAQKEAEQKEKEREKRARKKDKRKAATEDRNDMNGGESARGFEVPTETAEPERIEKPVTITKRSQKPSQFTKQKKAKSMPLPLCNRGKRRMKTWMWVALTAVMVLALFLVGNSSFSFNFGLQRFGF